MKLELIKYQLDEIINSGIIKAIFTVDSINSDNDCTIDLYLLINKEQYKVTKDFINNIFISYNNLLFYKDYIFNDYYKTSYYYENSININIYYLNQLNIKLLQEKITIYDPNNLLEKLPKIILPYTNSEYAKLLDEFSILLFDLYKGVLNDDKLLSYNVSLNIQNVYTKIYRGFYDSLNAKKEFKEANKTMSKNFYHDLIDRIKLFRYDTFFDAVRQYINDVDLIVSKLPISVISLFNMDFYNYTKKLIYAL